MKIDIKRATTHTPLFIGKTNLGLRLESGNRGLVLSYDDEKDELLVYFNGEVAKLGTYDTIVPFDPEAFGPLPEVKKTAPIKNPDPSPAPRGKVKAQVGGPMDHVHQGPGAGKFKN